MIALPLDLRRRALTPVEQRRDAEAGAAIRVRQDEAHSGEEKCLGVVDDDDEQAAAAAVANAPKAAAAVVEAAEERGVMTRVFLL